MLNGLDLFSGIGGITKALEPWVRPIAYCENDKYCQAILLSRMWSNELHFAPIWDDVCSLHGDYLKIQLGSVDIIYGGFPCQDISVAGTGKGLAGERSGLFFEIIRLVSEVSPTFVFLENVPAIRTKGLQEVIDAFTKIGYDCRWTCLSAASLGAPHKRERWFLLAHANSKRVGIKSGRIIGKNRKDSSQSIDDGEKKRLADTESLGFESLRNAGHASVQREDGKKDPNHRGCKIPLADSKSIGSHKGPWREGQQETESVDPFSESWWTIEPKVGRVVDGLPLRSHRLRALGNAVVPLQARVAFEKLMGFK